MEFKGYLLEVVQNEIHGVFSLAVAPNLIMQMRTGGFSAITHKTNHFPAVNPLTFGNVKFRKVTVPGNKTIAMVNCNHPAHITDLADLFYNTTGGSHYRGTNVIGNINTQMHGSVAGKGVISHTVTA